LWKAFGKFHNLQLSSYLNSRVKGARYGLQFVTGWMLALVFQVAHVVGEAEFPELDPSSDTPKVAAGWAALQVPVFHHSSSVPPPAGGVPLSAFNNIYFTISIWRSLRH
jgi:hypothetical protein